MSAIEIRRIDHIVLRVRDVAVSKRFYCDALGCTVERESEVLGLHQLRAGASLIDLVPVAGPLGRLGGVGPGAEGMGPSMYIRDPDGNVVELKGPARPC